MDMFQANQYCAFNNVRLDESVLNLNQKKKLNISKKQHKNGFFKGRIAKKK